MVLERSTDPNEEDPDDFTSPGIQPNTFLAGIATVRISDRNEATLFVGERRSGPRVHRRNVLRGERVQGR